VRNEIEIEVFIWQKKIRDIKRTETKEEEIWWEAGK